MAGARGARIEQLMARFINAGEIAGGAVVVALRGEVVLEHAAGTAAPGLAVGPHVLWPLASISKVYAAATIMRLVELGELTLNTRVCTVLPAYTGERREEVRLRPLLTHTAGMLYESPAMEERLQAQTPLAELVREALAAPLLFAPGTAVRYSDYHYLIAGHMAEHVTGRPFPELMQTLVLTPARLLDTG